jgi:ABC-type multidrug transport system permease subunit
MIKYSNPLLQLTRARVMEFIREPEAIFWVFVFPVLMALGLGIAFRNRPAESLRIAVEQGNGATALAATLDSFPDLDARVLQPETARNELRTGKIAVVVVPGDSLTYVFDPSRSESQLARRTVDDAVQRSRGRTDPVPVGEQHLTEPGSRYIDFLIPGLLGLNLMGSGMWGIGFNIVQARRRKLLKRLLATPMRKSEYLLSYILSRFVFMVLEVAALIGFGWLVFDVRVYGSILDLLVVSVVGALAFAGLGMLTASRARTVEGVSGIMNVVMMPMWIFSGVFFSYARFPDALQPAIKALPLTPLLDALRAVMTDGAPLTANLGRLSIVAAWGIIGFLVALKIFRWN